MRAGRTISGGAPVHAILSALTLLPGRRMNPDGTRLIFWLDVLVLLIGVFMALWGKWDFVLAMAIALVMMNGFDTLQNRRRKP